MRAEDILNRKGRETVTIGADELVATAANVLDHENIGALVVTDDDGGVAGILSERDIVRSLARRGAETLRTEVEDLMTRQTLTCTPSDNVKDLMERVTSHRVRHLPVLDNGTLSGIISIGDLLKVRLQEVETEQQVLRERLLDC